MNLETITGATVALLSVLAVTASAPTLASDGGPPDPRGSLPPNLIKTTAALPPEILALECPPEGFCPWDGPGCVGGAWPCQTDICGWMSYPVSGVPLGCDPPLPPCRDACVWCVHDARCLIEVGGVTTVKCECVGMQPVDPIEPPDCGPDTTPVYFQFGNRHYCVRCVARSCWDAERRDESPLAIDHKTWGRTKATYR